MSYNPGYSGTLGVIVANASKQSGPTVVGKIGKGAIL